MDTLTYLRLKAIVTLFRGAIKASAFIAGMPTHPDEVKAIPSRDPTRTIKANIYNPKASTRPSPVLINLHGSGFVFPMHGSDDEFCRFIAGNTQYTVIDVAYRMAPENPFPAALNDVEDVVRWVLDMPQEFDLAHISLGGFSAGGNLALVASSSTFQKGVIRSVIAFYPPTDLFKDPNLKVAPDTSGSPIPPFMMRTFNDCYLPPSMDRKDPLVSPLYTSPEKFPNQTLIITCAQDSLAPEAEELAEKIRTVPEINVVCRRMEQCGHAWNLKTTKGTPQDDAKNEAYALVVDMLKT